MAKVTIPNIARGKMADARAGKKQLPPIAKIAFGDGGVDSSGAVITPLPTSTALNHELMRADITTVEKISQTSYRYGYTIAEGGAGWKER